MKKYYNVLFPLWMLLLSPYAFIYALIILPVNYFIDSIVLKTTLKYLGIYTKDLYKKIIFKVWLFGFLADFVGVLFLNLARLHSNETFYSLANAFDTPINIFLIGHCLLAIILSSVCIYFFNLKYSFKIEINNKYKKKLALSLATFTAPFTFLIPFGFVFVLLYLIYLFYSIKINNKT